MTIAELCKFIPNGIVCFFPSFAFLEIVIKLWKNEGVFETINSVKKVIFYI